jgi:putative hydrolase of the HAD superfamily
VVNRAVLFDMDDTLYPEGEFYRSGFAVVAEELRQRGVGPSSEISRLMEFIHFNESRENVFDKAAVRLGYPLAWVPELVGLFHRHKPRVTLPEESIRALTRLRPQYRLGIVTDGHAAVQRRKIEALGVAPFVDAIVVTDDLGREHWKPDPLPFLTCCKALQVLPQEAVFVGDNPDRDILGALGAGLAAIRIRRPDAYFRDVERPELANESCEINTLSELQAVLARIRMQNVSL